MSLSKLEGSCANCGNNKDDQFWEIRWPHHDGHLWGVCCRKKKCQTEYFIQRFTEEEEEEKELRQIEWDGEVLTMKMQKPRDTCSDGFQARLDRERRKEISRLKPGDHIMWKRWYVIWHHGIVVKVRRDSYDVIHWHKVNKKITILKQTLHEEDLTNAFVVTYENTPSGVADRELRMARAYSRLHEEDPVALPRRYCQIYGVIESNCEHFATYCAVGTSTCYQTKWAFTQVIESTESRVLAIVVAEGVENMAKAPEIAGFGAVALVEGSALVIKSYKLLKLFKQGKITMKVFWEELGRSIGGLTGSVLGGALGMLFYFCPPLEIVLSPLLALIGRIGGQELGFAVSLAITDGMIKRDEKVVTSRDKLQKGDHIVQTNFLGLRRTHSIFVGKGSKYMYIIVIMFRKKRIQKKEIKCSSIRRMIYKEEENLADPDTVVERASALIADPAPRVPSRKRQITHLKMK